jgi:Zn-finger nucleic acid-binding protein
MDIPTGKTTCPYCETLMTAVGHVEDEACPGCGLVWTYDEGMTPRMESVRALVAKAVAAEREREREHCARVVESFDAVNEDGERVNPGLGYSVADVPAGWYDYVPDAAAIAAKIRKGE